ncbi:hypothetical protein SSBG_02149 [Streptomyces sp. SPB074]|nr:hypothetical protein SSBG_02149 [Streptomyces sp. SPB074]
MDGDGVGRTHQEGVVARLALHEDVDRAPGEEGRGGGLHVGDDLAAASDGDDVTGAKELRGEGGGELQGVSFGEVVGRALTGRPPLGVGQAARVSIWAAATW